MLSFSSRTRLVPSGNHRSSSRTLVVVARSQQPLSTMTTPIQEYIDKHGLQKKVEDVLNACVQAKPADPLAYMVRSAERCSAVLCCRRDRLALPAAPTPPGDGPAQRVPRSTRIPTRPGEGGRPACCRQRVRLLLRAASLSSLYSAVFLLPARPPASGLPPRRRTASTPAERARRRGSRSLHGATIRRQSWEHNFSRPFSPNPSFPAPLPPLLSSTNRRRRC